MIPNKILFCTDFSGNSLPAKVYAVDFAKAFGASLRSCTLSILPV